MRYLRNILLAALAGVPANIGAQTSEPPTGLPTPGLAPATGSLALHLVCHGTGDHAITHSSSAALFGRRHIGSVFGTSQEQAQFGDTMDVEIAGQDAKVRVPRRFLPALHGGEGGWFGVKDLSIDSDTIAGTVLINYANHPKMRIDRRTGTIDLDGKVGAYAGSCEPYDPATAKRAF